MAGDSACIRVHGSSRSHLLNCYLENRLQFSMVYSVMLATDFSYTNHNKYWSSTVIAAISIQCCCSTGVLSKEARTRNATPPRTSLAEGSRENPVSFMCSCPPLPSRQCATVPCWDSKSDVWRWITLLSQVWIDIDTTRAVNATSHSRWPYFSSGRCTGLECIAFVA